jgi:hypothetical protein
MIIVPKGCFFSPADKCLGNLGPFLVARETSPAADKLLGPAASLSSGCQAFQALDKLIWLGDKLVRGAVSFSGG